MAPPRVQFEQWGGPGNQADMPEIELQLAQHLREFLNQSYGLHDPTRPTEFLGGAWKVSASTAKPALRPCLTC
jgi:hypothetical protein